MSVKKMLELCFYNTIDDRWEQCAPKTTAEAVETAGGGSVQEALDAVPSIVSDAKTQLLGGAPGTGDTLGKLFQKIEAVAELLENDYASNEAVEDIVDLINAHKGEIAAAIDGLSQSASVSKTIISLTPPDNPIDGQLWLKPVAVI